MDKERVLTAVMTTLGEHGRLNKNGLSGRDGLRLFLVFQHLDTLGYRFDDGEVMAEALAAGYSPVFVHEHLPDALAGEHGGDTPAPETYAAIEAWAQQIVSRALTTVS